MYLSKQGIKTFISDDNRLFVSVSKDIDVEVSLDEITYRAELFDEEYL